MRPDVSADMDWAQSTLRDQVLPVMRELFGGGQFASCESSRNEVLRHLDLDAGIDLLHKDEHGIRSIAMRIQRIPDSATPYRTFTVRKERPTGTRTEREKRLYAIDHGYLHPQITVQAYVRETSRELLLVGIVQPSDFMRHEPSGTRIAGNGGQIFDFYEFDYLRRLGYTVREWSSASHQYLLRAS